MAAAISAPAAQKLEFSVEEPLNREPSISSLVSSFYTETDGFDRNHGPIPHLDAASHRVKVDGEVVQKLSLSSDDLTSLPQHTVICALQCAGNRRHTMRTEMKEVQGVDWFDGAVMNCKWEGPLLADVLRQAGVRKENLAKRHVAFACHQVKVQEDDWYGGSIDLTRALDATAEVILALKMNGLPLTPRHGFPVRVVVPGVAGARSVKWLDRITVQSEESPNFYQQNDYKVLPPEADSKENAEEFWSQVPAIQDMPINSVIAVPTTGATVHTNEQGLIDVQGYALPAGADGPIVKVEVSVDDGGSWQEVPLENSEGTGKFAWCLWRTSIEVPRGKGRRIVSRATDSAGNVQRERPEWNLRGVCYNGYGEVKDLEVH